MKPLMTKEAAVDNAIHMIGKRFRTFGGGRDSDTNPIAHAMRNEPLAFAANVDVRAVVERIYELWHEAPKRTRRRCSEGGFTDSGNMNYPPG